jgi:beta-glucosidase
MAGRGRARRLVLGGALMIAWLLVCLLPQATAAAAAAAVRRSDFPPSFLFGTATSSYQVHA